MNKKLKSTNKKETKLSSKNIFIKLSLVFNCVILLVIALITLGNIFHVFDYAIVNKGIDIICDDSNFKNNAFSHIEDATERQRAIATTIDYNCSQNGAETYYADGLDRYLESLGLPKTE